MFNSHYLSLGFLPLTNAWPFLEAPLSILCLSQVPLKYLCIFMSLHTALEGNILYFPCLFEATDHCRSQEIISHERASKERFVSSPLLRFGLIWSSPSHRTIWSCLGPHLPPKDGSFLKSLPPEDYLGSIRRHCLCRPSPDQTR